MSYDTIIFDLDGTISDPSLGIVRSANFALESLGYETVEGSKVRPLIGPPLQELLGELAGDVSGKTMNQLIARYRERYASTGYAENELYDGVQDVISELSKRGHRLGVCTSKRTDFAEKILNMFGLSDYFGFVDGGDIGIEKTEQLAGLVGNGLKPATAVMIGGRAVDILAARANEIRSVGVLWGFGEQHERSRACPDYVVETPADLPGLFGES
ncbi:MAG: HAD family hydrolase [Gammaproteobacteria bacterium]